MALPEYYDVYDWVHGQGLEPLPAPTKRPTKKGLGRYLRDCLQHNADDDVERWQRTWFSCTTAYDVMLNRFSVRLPSTTFLDDRIKCEADLYYARAYDERDENGNPLPEVSVDRELRRKAYRWATSR